MAEGLINDTTHEAGLWLATHILFQLKRMRNVNTNDEILCVLAYLYLSFVSWIVANILLEVSLSCYFTNSAKEYLKNVNNRGHILSI